MFPRTVISEVDKKKQYPGRVFPETFKPLVTLSEREQLLQPPPPPPLLHLRAQQRVTAASRGQQPLQRLLLH